MLNDICLKTDCRNCPHHNNCLLEREMLNTIKQLNLIDKAKYELCVLNSKQKK